MDSPRARIVARLTVTDLPSLAHAAADVPAVPARSDVPSGPAMSGVLSVPAASDVPSGPAAPSTSALPSVPSTSHPGIGPAPTGTLRVPALLALPTGRLLLVHDHRPTPRATDWAAGGALPDDLPNSNTLWLRLSDDAGASWSQPRRLVPGLSQGGREDSDVPPFLRVTGVSDPSLLLGPDGAVHLFAAASTDVGLFGAHAPTRPTRPDHLPEPGTLRLLHAVSRDDGETWAWEDLTDLFLPAPGVASGGVGFPVSGHGTSVDGRLVQPLVTALPPRQDGSRPVRAQALVSDDDGATWRLALPIPAPAQETAASLAGGAATSGVDEWAVVGLPPADLPEATEVDGVDEGVAGATSAGSVPGAATAAEAERGVRAAGTLVVSARDGGYGGSRLVARSKDGGRSWSVPQPERGLPDPGCNGGLVAVPASAIARRGVLGADGEVVLSNAATAPGTGAAGDRLAATGSVDVTAWVLVCSHAADPAARRCGRLTASWDSGRTWQALADLTGPEESFAYSDLAWLPGGDTGGFLVIVAEDAAGDLVVWRLSW